MIWFFDGSKQAFLTAFVYAYRDEDAVLSAGNSQLMLGQKSCFVRADAQKARRAEERLKTIDPACMKELDLLLRSGENNRGQIAFAYFRLIAARQRPVRGMLAEDAVTDAAECIRRVTTELHRFKGFVRFMESASGALYAPIAPDHDICDLLVPHFARRMPHIPFVLHDVRRAKAAVWDGKHAFTAPLAQAEIALSADEAMKGYMPVRYWKFMPEDPASLAESLRQAPKASPRTPKDGAPHPNGSPRSPHGCARP